VTGPKLENIPRGEKYIKEANVRLGRGQNYNKYNKMNNNLEKFLGGQDCC